MAEIKITTDRLPQPDRCRGAVISVTQEKADHLVGKGWAEMLEAAPKPAPKPRVKPRKKMEK